MVRTGCSSGGSFGVTGSSSREVDDPLGTLYKCEDRRLRANANLRRLVKRLNFAVSTVSLAQLWPVCGIFRGPGSG